MEELIDYLKKLELSELEAKLYLTLLKTGPTSVRDLATNIHIKRTTAYFYVDQLIEKGFVIKLVKESKKLVAANDPENLEQLVEKKLAGAEAAKKDFMEIAKLIEKKLPDDRNFDQGDIRYYKGKAAIKKVYDDSLSGTELRVYANLAILEQLLAKSDFILPHDIYEKALEKNKELKIYEVVADKPGTIDQFELDETTSKNSRYQHKYMPQSIGLTSPGIAMFKNKVVIISGQNEPHITVLENRDYYENSIKLFDFIWNVLPGPKEK